MRIFQFLFENEFYKIFKNKIIIILILLLVIVQLSGFAIFKLSVTNLKFDDPLQRYKFLQDEIKLKEESLKIEKSKSRKNLKAILYYEQTIKEYNDELMILKKILKETSPKERLIEKIKVLRSQFHDAEKNNDIKKMEEININIKVYESFIKKNIFDEYKSIYNNIASIIAIILESICSFYILYIIIAILTYNIVNEEFNNKTIRLLLIGPVTKIKIYLSKILTGIITILLLIIISTLPIVILGYLTFKTMRFDIPAVGWNYYERIGTDIIPISTKIEIITIGIKYLRMLGWIIIYISMIMSLQFLIALNFNKSNSYWIINGIIILIGIIINKIKSLNIVSFLYPLNLSNVGSIVNNTYSYSHGIVINSPILYICIILGWNLVFLILGIYIFNKKVIK